MLPVALHDYGTEVMEFLNDNYLLLHIKDKRKGQYKTGIVDLGQKKAVTDFNLLPEKFKNLFQPIVRQHRFASPRITTSEVSVSEDGIVVLEGAHSKVGQNQFKYWVSLFSQGSQPVYYYGHRWIQTALTHSPETGLCASADKFGEIHVWRASDGKRTNLFKPVNDNFHHVQWFNDESGVYLATKTFGRRSNLRYGFNQYGPINHSIKFGDWTRRPAEATKGKYSPSPSIRDQRTGAMYRLAVRKGLDDVLVIASDGRQFSLFESVANDLNKNIVEKWGNPTCFNFLRSPQSDGRLPFVVGTDQGFLLQFEIESIEGRDRPKLARTFLAHEAQINSISESPSGKLMASVGLDGTVRIWRLGPVRTLADVGFVTDGTRIIDLGENEGSGLEAGDGVISFDDGPYYERIQKIQRGDYQPGDMVSVTVERFEEVGGEWTPVEKTFSVRLIAAADITEPILNFFSAGSEAWIAWTKNGFYDASAKGARHLGWHVNQGRDSAAEFSKVQQFKNDLYRPDLVRAVAENWQSIDELVVNPPAPNSEPGSETTSTGFAGDDSSDLDLVLNMESAKKALQSAPNTYEKYEERRPPQIRIQKPYGTTETDQSEIQIEFVVESPIRLPITDLSIFNNGRTVRVAANKASEKKKDGIQFNEYTATIELEPGVNNLALKAKHAKAYSDLAEVTVDFKSSEPIDETLPKLFVLSVGISDYENDDLDLTYAAQDAEDFVTAWKRQLGRRYSQVEAMVVTDEDATVDGIEDGFAWLCEQEISSEDFVFVFFAGHALFDLNDVWVFGSTDLSLGRRLTRSGITDDRINRLLEKELGTAGTVILFLDTCHAGGVKGKTRGTPAKRYHSQGKDIWLDSQRHVIASCTQNEVSLENAVWENGAFTEGLLQAMACEKCDVDGNGFISIEELKLKTREFVRKMTNNKQTPTASGQSLNHGVTELVEVQ